MKLVMKAVGQNTWHNHPVGTVVGIGDSALANDLIAKGFGEPVADKKVKVAPKKKAKKEIKKKVIKNKATKKRSKR